MKEFKPTPNETVSVLIFSLLIGFGTNSFCLGFAAAMLGASLAEIAGYLKMILNQEK
jgi:hypothetical protein